MFTVIFKFSTSKALLQLNNQFKKNVSTNSYLSSDFGALDFTENLAVIGNDNYYLITIILVNNVALDHRAVRKPDYEGLLWGLIFFTSAPEDNIAPNLGSLSECDVPVDSFQVFHDGGFCESDGPVNRAQRSVDLHPKFAANRPVDGACTAVDGGVRTYPDTAVDGSKVADLTVISNGNAAVNGPAFSGDSASVSNGDTRVYCGQRTIVSYAVANPG